MQSIKNDNLILDPSSFYFIALHLRFSSLFYSTSLVDIFSYELTSAQESLTSTNRNDSAKYLFLNKGMSTITVYNFHTLNTQNRFFIFLPSQAQLLSPNHLVGNTSQLVSVSELFSASNWLERECAELHGISFLGKKDLRNLMLQYGDSSAPFQKSFPSIGLKEMYYNPLKDTIIQNPISLQI